MTDRRLYTLDSWVDELDDCIKVGGALDRVRVRTVLLAFAEQARDGDQPKPRFMAPDFESLAHGAQVCAYLMPASRDVFRSDRDAKAEVKRILAEACQRISERLR